MKKLWVFLFAVIVLWVGLCARDAAAQLADLAVEFKGPSAAYPGEDMTAKIEITVKNTGGSDARGFYVDIILRESTGTEHICARERIGNIIPKKSVHSLFDTKHPVVIPGDIQPGKYQLCAFADPTDTVRESRERNNKVCRPITIRGKDF
jgi:subtilase family serine protease